MSTLHRYRCNVEQEESYTSKADYLAGDFIPVYQEGNNQHFTFSSVRKGRMYTTKVHRIINADINASANIGRKAFPEQFIASACDILSRPVVCRHPDHGLSSTR